MFSALITYAEAGHQAGQIDEAWRKHVKLLEAGDGLSLDQTVLTVLHHSTAHQTRGPHRTHTCTLTWGQFTLNNQRVCKGLTCMMTMCESVYGKISECTLQIRPHGGDEGVKAAAQALLHLCVCVWS